MVAAQFQLAQCNVLSQVEKVGFDLISAASREIFGSGTSVVFQTQYQQATPARRARSTLMIFFVYSDLIKTHELIQSG